MSTALDRLPRLLSLLPWFLAHPGVSLSQAAAELQLPERELERDLELLFLCGLPGGGPGELIDVVVDADRVEVRDAQGLERPLRLSADEALALIVAVQALSQVPGLTERQALDRVAAKLAAAAGGGAPAALQAADAVAVAEPDAGAAGELLAVARDALAQQRRVHLRYLVEARDEVTERDVDPMRLHQRQGHWYLEGWCHRAQGVRLFRLDRIEELRLLDEPATVPEGVHPLDRPGTLFQASATDVRVELVLDPAARWVVEHYPTETVTEAPDGTLRASLRTPDTSWVVRLALRLGGAARVVAPPSVAREVQDAARRALALVQGTPEPGAPPLPRGTALPGEPAPR